MPLDPTKETYMQQYVRAREPTMQPPSTWPWTQQKEKDEGFK
jgi:hypothetical protein